MAATTSNTAAASAAAPARINKVASHSIAILAVQVVVLGSAVANNFLIAHLGGPEGKGILYSLQLVSGVLGLSLLHFCLGSAAIVLLRQDGGSREEIAAGIFLPSIFLGSIPVIALAVSWPWASHLVNLQMPPVDLWLGMLAIPAMVLTFNAGYFCLGEDRLRYYNWLTSAPSLLLSLTLAALWLLHRTEIAILIAAWCVSILTPSVFSGYLMLKAAKGRLLPSYGLFKKMYQFGWRAHLCGALQQLQHRSPVVLVGLMLPVAQLGIYSLSISLVELLWYIPNTLAVALLPHVAGSSKEEASRFTPAICRVTLAVTAALGVMLAVVCSFAIPRILPRFTPGLAALWILMPGLAIASISRVMASDLNGRNQPMKMFYPVFTGLVVETVLGLYAVPHYGITGAAVVTVVGYVLNTALQVPIYCRVAGVSASSVLLLQRHDVAAISRAVRQRVERLREILAPEYAA
jgi:O-antigen/teichoic acid export membrane protein